MIENKKTIEEVGIIVGTEGLGYAIQDYLHYSKIQDKKLSILWKEAFEKLNEVDNYLKDCLGEDFFGDF